MGAGRGCKHTDFGTTRLHFDINIMQHLYNANNSSIDRYWLMQNGFVVSKPKATQCMTAEQLIALEIVGIYGEPEDDDESVSDTAPTENGLAGVLPRNVPEVEADVGIGQAGIAESRA